MRKNILLTGTPGCGKTTLIKQVVERFGDAAGGFYTREIREGGARRGFQIVTFDGHEGVLAHVNIQSARRIGKYGVDLAALESVGVASIRRALARNALVVIDEIGPMEMLSESFRQATLDALDSDCAVFGSVVKRSAPFSDQVKARPDVTVIEVTPANRDVLIDSLVGMLREAGA
jgi:nucleoside-triphosphatase